MESENAWVVGERYVHILFLGDEFTPDIFLHFHCPVTRSVNQTTGTLGIKAVLQDASDYSNSGYEICAANNIEYYTTLKRRHSGTSSWSKNRIGSDLVSSRLSALPRPRSLEGYGAPYTCTPCYGDCNTGHMSERQTQSTVW
jgi:hypothetical protein